jgi:hypothetical protein
MKKYLFLITLYTLLFTVSVNALNITTNSSHSKYNFIYATGRIHSGDLYRLQRAVNSLRSNKQTIVVFSSMGGELQEGIKLGKYIYRNRLATAVKQNSMCASSCAIAFLGGRDIYGRKMMILPSSSKLGYHNFYYKSKSRVNVAKVQNDLSSIVDYFSYVRAPNRLMSKMLNTKPNNMYWITQHSNRMLSLRRGIHIKNRYSSASTSYYKSYSNTQNQKEALKKYFYNINKAIQSSRGYAYNNVALNNTTTYKFWLENNLNYVYLKSIKLINKHTLEANVVYSLKNGLNIYSKNRYKLAKNSNGWKIVSRKITPHRASRKAIQSIKHKLP